MTADSRALRTLRVELEWSLFATYTVNLLDVPTHQHGPNGPHYVSYKDATELLHRCLTAFASGDLSETP